jgi:uncharacterized membrane protein (DUF2068 family)
MLAEIVDDSGNARVTNMPAVPDPAAPAGEQPEALGFRLIVAYKFAKAAALLLLGTLILSFASAGLADELRTVALNMRNHATAAWSVALAKWLMNAATSRNLRVVAIASLLDAAASLFEGWALHRRFGWSRWLVILTTSSLLPFEAIAIVRHFSAGRVALILINVFIVVYLVRHHISRVSDTPHHRR